jgi:hypothetical protein
MAFLELKKVYQLNHTMRSFNNSIAWSDPICHLQKHKMP